MSKYEYMYVYVGVMYTYLSDKRLGGGLPQEVLTGQGDVFTPHTGVNQVLGDGNLGHNLDCGVWGCGFFNFLRRGGLLF